MKIGIDARFYQESGVGRYLRNLIDNLQNIDKKNNYFVFLLKRDYETFEIKTNFQKELADFSWYGIEEQTKFPNLLNKFNLDLMHFPHFNAPLFCKGKFIVTIHDLIHQHFQMKRATTLNPFVYFIKNLGYKRVFKNAITKSEKIITPSNYVADLLVKQWNIKTEKITVTKESVDEKMISTIKTIPESKINQILKRFNVNQPFIFYVGNAHPHKNVEGLIKAFVRLRKRYQYLQLVLSGFDHYFWQRIKEEYKHKDIIFTGKISDEELIAFYKKAKCFVMPSFEEGFGIPLLEAMACGCPVVSSNKGSLLEIGEDAAIYFDPYNLEDMVEKVGLILNDPKLTGRLIEKGIKRVKEFSFRKMAIKTLEVYESCNRS